MCEVSTPNVPKVINARGINDGSNGTWMIKCDLINQNESEVGSDMLLDRINFVTSNVVSRI